LNNGAALTVSDGDDAAGTTIEVFARDWNDGGNEDAPSIYVLTPNMSPGFAVSVRVTESGSNDDNAAIPITVTFYISGSGTSGASIAVT